MAARVRASEGYGDHAAEVVDASVAEHCPPLALAVLPLVLVVAGALVFTRVVIPALDTSYLAEPRFGRVTLDEVRRTAVHAT